MSETPAKTEPGRTSFRSAATHALRRMLRVVIIAYLVVVVLLTFLQRKLMYHPSRATRLPVAQVPEVMSRFSASQDVEVVTPAGTTVRGWLMRVDSGESQQETARRPLAIYFHGNAGHRGGRLAWYQLLTEAGADVLAMDYPGYGDSDGTMTEAGLEQTADAAWKYAIQSGWEADEITIVGTSLGGAAAVYLASQQSLAGHEPRGLAVVATFSSMVDVAGSLYRWLPVRAVLVDRYPSAERIQQVTCPVIVLHGDDDDLVHQQFGRKLYEAAPAQSSAGIASRWVSLPGVGHRNIIGEGRSLILPELRRLIASETPRRR